MLKELLEHKWEKIDFDDLEKKKKRLKEDFYLLISLLLFFLFFFSFLYFHFFFLLVFCCIYFLSFFLSLHIFFFILYIFLHSKNFKIKAEFTMTEVNNEWNINFLQNSSLGNNYTHFSKFSISQHTMKL